MQVQVASGISVAVRTPTLQRAMGYRWNLHLSTGRRRVGPQRPYRAKVQRIDLVDETAETALFTAASMKQDCTQQPGPSSSKRASWFNWALGQTRYGWLSRPTAWNDIFVKRPVIAVVVSLLLLLADSCAIDMPVLQFPVIKSSSIQIITPYPAQPQNRFKAFHHRAY